METNNQNACNVKLIYSVDLRFSGLTAADMKGATTALHDVQTDMLKMISDKTILIGHSLESDFVALKVSLIIICYPLYLQNNITEMTKNTNS